MGGRKNKSIEELEKELAELIEKSGWSKQDIQKDYNDYCALQYKANSGSQRMKDLKDAYHFGTTIHNRKNNIRAARKVASASASAAAAAAVAVVVTTSNVANTSMTSFASAASMDSSMSTSINVNKITASFESTPSPPLSGLSNYFSIVIFIIQWWSQSQSQYQSYVRWSVLILASHLANEITASFNIESQSNSNG